MAQGLSFLDVVARESDIYAKETVERTVLIDRGKLPQTFALDHGERTVTIDNIKVDGRKYEVGFNRNRRQFEMYGSDGSRLGKVLQLNFSGLDNRHGAWVYVFGPEYSGVSLYEKARGVLGWYAVPRSDFSRERGGRAVLPYGKDDYKSRFPLVKVKSKRLC